MNGESGRSRNGQTMFTHPHSKSPFSKLRFDVDSLVNPLAGGGGAASVERGSLRFGLPADPLMDDVLRNSPPVPRDFVSRLHLLVDELTEDTAA